MQKVETCQKCSRRFALTGPTNGTKELPHGTACPCCGEPHDVLWPSGSALPHPVAL